MRLLMPLFFLLMSLNLFAQEGMLTLDEYITIVKHNHPIAFQANLLKQKGDATKRIARGNFDPKIDMNINNKSFDGLNYYTYSGGTVKIPTWYGIEAKAGFENSSGTFLNPSDKLPSAGLWNAGISVPLGKGLVIDKRRAELKKADLYISMNEQERVLMINNLLYEATISYVEWQVTQAHLAIAEEGQALAEERFNGTKISFINGDKAAIDTLETFIALQSRQLDYQKALQNKQNAALALNNYMWMNGEVPLELEENTVAENINIGLLNEEIMGISLIQEQWIAAHPELLLYDYKIDNINIEQKLAKEALKPDLRVNYNPLLALGEAGGGTRFNPNDYKIGAALYYPIFQRKERGKIQLNRIKMQETELERSIKSQSLNVKLNTYLNNIEQTQEQYTLLNETVENYYLMLQAENTKLAVGESSIFLVNSRENKYLQSRYKAVELSQKLIFYRIAYLLFSAKLEEVL